MSEQQKIAILGGGVSAMTAAVYLTEKANWQQQFDITVYQQGWRLGGKGASGRNANMGQRIEEHGLHVWFGAYVNSFRTIERVYQALDRPATHPMATWQQAFKPHDVIALQEHINGQWQPWAIEFPRIEGNPSAGTLDLHFWQIARLLVAWLEKFVDDIEHELAHKPVLTTRKRRDQHLLASIMEQVQSTFSSITLEVSQFYTELRQDAQQVVSNPRLLLEQLSALLNLRVNDESFSHKPDRLGTWYIVRKLKRWLREEVRELLDDNAKLRQAYICADLAIAMLVGLIRDKIHERGFASINDRDLRQWLSDNGADPHFSVDSAPVRGFYDLVFGYQDGDFSKPNVEAGVAALAILRILLCYRGGVMWKMQAGMGDVIFAPIYELLKQRGVKFAFFHQVQQLYPDSSGRFVQKIELCKQVDLKHPDYHPLVDIHGLPCWPSEPLYTQINADQAQLLKTHNINLESHWSDWEAVYEHHFSAPLERITLERAVDFDHVICGVSVASMEHIAPALLATDTRLATSVKELGTVATQAMQLWLNKDDRQLGWQASTKPPILSAFSKPFDTWAAMAHLLPWEQWPEDNQPVNVAYFCSAYTCADFPPASDTGFVQQQLQNVKNNCLDKLKHSMHWLWPEAGDSEGFQWHTLYAPASAQGEQRFDYQYWRVNLDPSERYVLSLTGTSQYRLHTQETDFSNLYITGDWISTGVNAGCVEAAVMAGMQTARALSGVPTHISGERGFLPW